MGADARIINGPLVSGPYYARLVGQIEHLAGINPVRITDLAGIGFVDRGVFYAVAIDAARYRPEIVAATDNGLARGKTFGIRIAHGDADHGRNGFRGRGWGGGRWGLSHVSDDFRRDVHAEVDFRAGSHFGVAGFKHIDPDALLRLGQHVTGLNQPAAIRDRRIGDERVIDIKPHGRAFLARAGKEGAFSLDLDRVDRRLNRRDGRGRRSGWRGRHRR